MKLIDAIERMVADADHVVAVRHGTPMEEDRDIKADVEALLRVARAAKTDREEESHIGPLTEPEAQEWRNRRIAARLELDDALAALDKEDETF